MDNEKLKQANEKSAAIDSLERKVRELARISSKTESCQPSTAPCFYSWADNRVAIPKELESVFDALLGDYYRKKLEQAKKEFEEM